MTMREKMARAGYERAMKETASMYPLSYAVAVEVAEGLQAEMKWEGAAVASRELWLAIADVQLDALLEPTEGMKAVNVAADRGPDDCAADFRAMIRAAKEGK